MHRRLVSALTLAFALLAVACGGSSTGETTTPVSAGHDHHDGMHDHEAGATNAALVPWKDAVVGDRTTCPVTNEEFVVAADSPHAEHEGHTYYFCCADCVAPFEADPARFLHPS